MRTSQDRNNPAALEGAAKAVTKFTKSIAVALSDFLLQMCMHNSTAFHQRYQLYLSIYLF